VWRSVRSACLLWSCTSFPCFVPCPSSFGLSMARPLDRVAPPVDLIHICFASVPSSAPLTVSPHTGCWSCAFMPSLRSRDIKTRVSRFHPPSGCLKWFDHPPFDAPARRELCFLFPRPSLSTRGRPDSYGNFLPRISLPCPRSRMDFLGFAYLLSFLVPFLQPFSQLLV